MYSEESLLYTERKVGAALNVLYSWTEECILYSIVVIVWLQL